MIIFTTLLHPIYAIALISHVLATAPNVDVLYEKVVVGVAVFHQ